MRDNMDLLTVKDLKKLIADMDDEAEVYIANGEEGDTYSAISAKQDEDGDLIIETIFYCS